MWGLPDGHALGTLKVSGLSRLILRLGFIRKFNSSSQCMRYARLWCQLNPFTFVRYKKHRPKPQRLWVWVSRSNQSAICSLSSLNLSSTLIVTETDAQTTANDASAYTMPIKSIHCLLQLTFNTKP